MTEPAGRRPRRTAARPAGAPEPAAKRPPTGTEKSDQTAQSDVGELAQSDTPSRQAAPEQAPAAKKAALKAPAEQPRKPARGRQQRGRGRGEQPVAAPVERAAADRLGTPPKLPKNGLRVFALGGIGEIGRNMTVFEYGGKLLIVDCGVLFPEDQQPGVDLILPDFRPIEDRMDDVEAIVLTHGHEDHIGAVPFLLRQRPDLTVVGSRFATHPKVCENRSVARIPTWLPSKLKESTLLCSSRGR